MFKTFHLCIRGVLPVGLVFLLGCSAQRSDVGSAPYAGAETVRPIFSVDTPVEIIAADQRGKLILDRDVPGLMASRSYILFDDMSLSQIATVSGGRLTKAKLDRVNADLSQIDGSVP
jgi:hypothetical protein